jgi:hypothetical protein
MQDLSDDDEDAFGGGGASKKGGKGLHSIKHLHCSE